jgi:hypothetical protein
MSKLCLRNVSSDRVDKTKPTSVLLVGRSVFVDRGFIRNGGFAVRKSPYWLILAAKY